MDPLQWRCEFCHPRTFNGCSLCDACVTFGARRPELRPKIPWHSACGQLAPACHSKPDDPDTYAIIGAAMEVHRILGCRFLEAPYRAALAIEFELRAIAFTSEVPIDIRCKHRVLPLSYRSDFICRDAVLVEVKALDGLGPVEVAQVLNYLKATRLGAAYSSTSVPAACSIAASYGGP